MLSLSKLYRLSIDWQFRLLRRGSKTVCFHESLALSPNVMQYAVISLLLFLTRRSYPTSPLRRTLFLWKQVFFVTNLTSALARSLRTQVLAQIHFYFMRERERDREKRRMKICLCSCFLSYSDAFLLSVTLSVPFSLSVQCISAESWRRRSFPQRKSVTWQHFARHIQGK